MISLTLKFCKSICIVNSKIKKTTESFALLKPSQIIRDIIVECEVNCRFYLPKKEAQKKKIYRRQNNLIEPDSLSTIKIPENFKYLEGR